MAIKVAINGFGRIGRNGIPRNSRRTFRISKWSRSTTCWSRTNLADMLKYDSVYAISRAKSPFEGNNTEVNARPSRLTAERDPRQPEVNEAGADLVIECTGFFLHRRVPCQAHIKAGAQKVVNVRSIQGQDPDVRVWREP